jgi:hypothetical protein
MQVNEVLETLLQQLQAHNHPHAGAVQAAINLAGAAVPGQKGLYASQVSLLLHSVVRMQLSAYTCTLSCSLFFWCVIDLLACMTQWADMSEPVDSDHVLGPRCIACTAYTFSLRSSFHGMQSH